MYVRKRIAAAIALIPLMAACGSSSSTPTTPSSTTETFTGTINQNSASTITFATSTSGTVSATLTSLAPLATLQLGFALGTWDGTSCQVVIVIPNATTGSIASANASTKGNYCVHLYDTGNIEAGTPVTYTVTVVHP